MVMLWRGAELYEGVKEAIHNHLINVIRPLMIKAIGNNFMVTLIQQWKYYKYSIENLGDVLLYLEKKFIANNTSNFEPIYNLGIRLFRGEVLDSIAITKKLMTIMLEVLKLEDSNKTIRREDFKSMVEMLLQVNFGSRNCYENHFEALLLKEASDYYNAVNKELKSESSARVVLCKVNDLKQKCLQLWDKGTEEKLHTLLQREIIIPLLKKIVIAESRDFAFIFKDDFIEEGEDLKLLYNLQKDVGEITLIIDAWNKCFNKYAQETIRPETPELLDPINYVQNLLDLKARLDPLMFCEEIQSNFERLVNRNSKISEFLSLFIDNKFKKSYKTIKETDMDNVLDKVFDLFRFIQEKDVFERYHRQLLAKRLLLHPKSTFYDIEKSIILKLKIECGVAFTLKLEGMFKDIEVSKNLMNSFKNRDIIVNEMDLSVNVLTKIYWPISQGDECNLSSCAERTFTKFKNFYLQKHNGRFLAINPSSGFADIKATFYNKVKGSDQILEVTKILTVTTYQMCILMAFNERETYTFNEMLDYTKISVHNLKRALIPLTLGKASQSVLKCQKRVTLEIEGDDILSINDEFISNLMHIHIKQLSNKSNDNEAEMKESLTKINNDRKCEIEAVIVRIMKSFQKLSHNELITQATKQLASRFLPDPLHIKKALNF